VFFSVALYVALVIFGLGLAYKISTWFRYKIGIEAGNIPTSKRVSEASKGILSTLFSPRILTLLRIFVLDVLYGPPILPRFDGLHLCFTFVSLVNKKDLGGDVVSEDG